MAVILAYRAADSYGACHHSNPEPWTILRIIFMGGSAEEQDNEPISADVGRRSIQRADDESAKAFLTGVRVQARLAAKPAALPGRWGGPGLSHQPAT